MSGVKRIRIHDLRHSHVSLLDQYGIFCGGNGEKNQLDESVEITYRYAHLFPTIQTEMAENLNQRNIWMSEKNRDNKNRWRNVTIAFRMSPEENEELDLKLKLCGYQQQEYIIESVLHQKVTAVGNPLMLVQFRKQLRG